MRFDHSWFFQHLPQNEYMKTGIDCQKKSLQDIVGSCERFRKGTRGTMGQKEELGGRITGWGRQR